MPQGKYLNSDEKDQIIHLASEGLNANKISKIISRHPVTVRKFLKSPSKYGKNIFKSGRKELLSQRQKRELIKEVNVRQCSVREAVLNIPQKVSATTAWRCLSSSYLQFKKKKLAPTLTNNHKKKRLDFAKNLLKKGPQFWSNIIFSDEKRFCLNGPDHYNYYWHDSRTDRSIAPDKNFSPGVMIWGAISKQNKNRLIFIEGKINSEKYISVLENELKPLFNGNNYIFQQDNAPVHKSVKTIGWLNANGIDLVDWPAYSPDLNIIENLWGILSHKIYAKKNEFSNIGDLKSKILEEWGKITHPTINALYESFPDRLLRVVGNKGGFILK